MDPIINSLGQWMAGKYNVRRLQRREKKSGRTNEPD